MQKPEILSGPSITRLLQGAALGIVATLIIGFTWGGWTLGSTAEKMASKRAGEAVVAVLAPACVYRFQQQPDLVAKWADFKKVDSWRRDAYIEKSGFATPVGSQAVNEDTAEKCASMLNTILEEQAKQGAKS